MGSAPPLPQLGLFVLCFIALRLQVRQSPEPPKATADRASTELRSKRPKVFMMNLLDDV
jgi:hypothetical protein